MAKMKQTIELFLKNSLITNGKKAGWGNSRERLSWRVLTETSDSVLNSRFTVRACLQSNFVHSHLLHHYDPNAHTETSRKHSKVRKSENWMCIVRARVRV